MTSIFTELTPGQIDLLLSIPTAEGTPPRQTDVIEQYQTRRDGVGSHGTLSAYLAELVDDGFVAVEAIDGRTKGYRLTGQGRGVLELLRDDIDRALEGNE